MDLKAAVEGLQGLSLRGALGLPVAVQRRLAGPPVVREGQTLATETQLMLRMQQLAGEPAVETLPLAQAREALVRQARAAGGSQQVGQSRDMRVGGDDGPLRARLYVPRAQLAPEDASGLRRPGPAKLWPALVFFHGGGMMYGDLDSHDAPCRFLAERAGVRVISVDYRLAPEHPYPSAVRDCAAAYRWVVDHAEELGVDTDRLAVGGDSAGGYLAATTAVTAAADRLPCAFQLLVYPVTDMAEESASRRLYAEGFFLTKRFLDGAQAAYLKGSDDPRDPWVSVLHSTSFPEGLAPAYVATAGFDPLRDEGEAYVRLLERHGVPVTGERFPGLVHGFLNVVGGGSQTRSAVERVAATLQDALSTADGRSPSG